MAKGKAVTGSGAQEKTVHATKVLDIRVRRIFINPKDIGPKAFVDLEFAGCLGVKGWRVIKSKKGDLFVSPERTRGKDKAGKPVYYDNFYGMTDTMRDSIKNTCLAAYEAELAKV